MEQVIGFNLIPVFEHVYVPDAWIMVVDKKGQPDRLLRRITLAQCKEFDLQPDQQLSLLIQRAEELHPTALEAYFTKTHTVKKKPSLAELWADKTLRVGMEAWLLRRIHLFFQLAAQLKVPLCFDAAKKPVLSHFLIQWPSNDTGEPQPIAQATLHLSRSAEALQYRLKVMVQETPVAIAESQILCLGLPGWFKYKGQIWQLSGVSGKMLLPFYTKEVVEVGKAHEATWLRSFLKKNLDGSAKIEDSAFGLTECSEFRSAELKLTKHLFNETWFLSLIFDYNGVQFYFGEKRNIQTQMQIPDTTDAEVQIMRTSRDAAHEQQIVTALLQLGLHIEDQQFILEAENNLTSLVQWLKQNESELHALDIQYQLEHPQTGAQILTTEPRLEVQTHQGQDWFDTQIVVHVGTYQIPFRALVPAIRKRQFEYTLPDGSLFLIPEVWFTRYHELAEYAAAEDNQTESIRIFTAQKSLLNTLELETSNPVDQLPFQLPKAWAGGQYLQAELRPYQKIGVDWMLSVLAAGQGACLADDMGLGKTLQTIAILAHIKQARAQYALEAQQGAARQLDLFAPKPVVAQPLRALIILPASLVFNWQAELRKFMPDAFVYAHVGPKRSTDRRAIAAHDIVLTTYQINREDAELLRSIDWQLLVLDESQYIKNRQAEMTKAVHQLKAPWRIALSGTPVENSLADLWSLMHFLNPGLLGSYTAFSRMYQQPIEREKNALTKNRLRELIRPFVMRRRKQEVAPDLPSLTKQVHLVPMTDAQSALYEMSKSAARNALLGIQDIKEQRFAALAALLRLRQLACHPALVGEDASIASGKFDFTLQLWQSVIDQGSKVLIFSSFEQHLLLYKHWFDTQGIPYAWISGSTKPSDRKGEVERFQTNQEVQTFFITLKAGGTGLNLTAADYVFLLDPWWNPQAEEQAIARAHRIGQERPVHAIRIISENTIEEKIRLLQQEKEALSQDLIDDELPADVGVEEMLALI
jgi:superfamily II DNA or RNA helicase